MLDLHKEYNTMMNRMNRYKTKPLVFEFGSLNGHVTRIELVEAKSFSELSYIAIYGTIGFSDKEQELLRITEYTNKRAAYHYWPKYHILERLA